MKPNKVYETIMSYGIYVTELTMDRIEIKEVPLRGACDTRSHIITKVFEGKDGESITLTV